MLRAIFNLLQEASKGGSSEDAVSKKMLKFLDKYEAVLIYSPEEIAPRLKENLDLVTGMIALLPFAELCMQIPLTEDEFTSIYKRWMPLRGEWRQTRIKYERVISTPHFDLAQEILEQLEPLRNRLSADLFLLSSTIALRDGICSIDDLTQWSIQDRVFEFTELKEKYDSTPEVREAIDAWYEYRPPKFLDDEESKVIE